MKKLALALAATLVAIASQAQTPLAATGGRAGYDCSKAPNPAQCEERRQKMRQALQDARKACEGRQGPERGECMRKETCARAQDPARCEMRAKEHAERRQKMMQACKDRQGEDKRACMREQRDKSGAHRPAPKT